MTKEPTLTKEKLEENKLEILEDIFQHYWWNLRGFGYRCNNSGELEKEMLALALESVLNNEIRKPQEKVKINMISKFKEFWRL